MTVSIRPMTLDELLALVELPREFTTDPAYVPPRESQTIVVNGLPGGGILLSQENELMIRVFERLQGQGVGTEACRQFFRLANDRGIREINARARPATGGYRLLVGLGATQIRTVGGEVYFAIATTNTSRPASPGEIVGKG